METIKGTLEKIEQSSGISKSGKPYTRFVYVVDGKKYSSFTMFDRQIGDKVVLFGRQDGKYWNLEDLKLDDGTVEATAPQETQVFNNAQALIKLSQQIDQLTAVVTQIRGLLANEKDNTNHVRVF